MSFHFSHNLYLHFYLLSSSNPTMTPSFADRTSAHLSHDRPWVQARLVRPCPFFTMTPRRLGSVSPGSRLHRRGRSHFRSRPGTWVSEVRRVLEYGNRDRGGERHQNFTVTQPQPLSCSLCTHFLGCTAVSKVAGWFTTLQKRI